MTNQEEIVKLRARYWGARTARAVNALTFQQSFKGNYLVDPSVVVEARLVANQAVVNYGLAVIGGPSTGENIYYHDTAEREFIFANKLLREAYTPIVLDELPCYNGGSLTEE